MPTRPFEVDVDYMAPVGLFLGGHGTPIERSFLPLDQAFTVIYGLNGSGKSYILESLNACLSGLRPSRELGRKHPMLLARFPDLDRVGNWFERAWAQGAVRLDEDVHQLQDLLESELPGAFGSAQDWYDFEELCDFDELVEPFAMTDTFAFVPTGTATPQWSFSPAVSSENAPALANYANKVAQLHEVDFNDAYEACVWAPVQLALHPQEPMEDMSGTYFTKWSRTLTLPREHAQLFDTVVVDGGEPADVLTARTLARQSSRMAANAEERTIEAVVEWLPSVAELLVTSVNRYFSALLRDAPILDLKVGTPAEWLAGSPLGWVAKRYMGDVDVPLDALSEAEKRWASIAIQLGCTTSSRPLIVLDEPEAALHRAAESQMSHALGDFARTAELQVVVASHSPDLLDARSASRIFVRRRTAGQDGSLIALEDSDSMTIEELGILPSDLLKRTRGFVLVEGDHDMQILQGHFRAELARLGVEILPLRGAGRLKSALDARFLFEFTDALLFPLLDDVALDPLLNVWRDAEATTKRVSVDKAVDQLVAALRAIPGKGTEYYSAFLTTALRRGIQHRVVPLGVAQTDILLYLPVEEFVPGAESWENLREALERDMKGVEPSETEFKRWLESAKRADLGPENVGKIARRAAPHRDLKAVLAAIAGALDPFGVPDSSQS